MYCILENEDIVVLTNLSQLMAKNLRNPFHAYMDGSTAGSQLRFWGLNPAWYTYLSPSVPYRTGNRAGTKDQTSAWCKIALFPHIRAIFLQPELPRLPPGSFVNRLCDLCGQKLGGIYGDPLTYVSSTVEDERKYRRKNQLIRRIRQGLDRNWTEIRRPKVTDIGYDKLSSFNV